MRSDINVFKLKSENHTQLTDVSYFVQCAHCVFYQQEQWLVGVAMGVMRADVIFNLAWENTTCQVLKCGVGRPYYYRPEL